MKGFTSVIALNGISKTFSSRGTEHRALKDITVHAAPGEVLGVLGPNGAGKSTLLRILTTALKPTSGSGSICGYDLVSEAASIRGVVGFVSGEFALYGRLTGVEYLRYFGLLNGMERKEIDDRTQELSARFRMEAFMGRRCSEYSTGMRQKISISRAILHRPRVLLFDEATSNLDIEASYELVGLVKELRGGGFTVLYTTHRISELEKFCDKLLVINGGQSLYSGGIGDLTPDGSESIEESYVRLLREGRRL